VTVPGDSSTISVRNPRRCAQRRYMRNSIAAQSHASVPPAPELISKIALWASYSPLSSVSRSSCSTSCWSRIACAPTSAAVRSSYSISSRLSHSWSSSAWASSRSTGSMRLRRRASCCIVACASAGFAQNSGDSLARCRRSISDFRRARSKMLAYRLQATASLLNRLAQRAQIGHQQYYTCCGASIRYNTDAGGV
jgi:hypothetical protein